MKFGCAIIILLNSENLICRSTDISNCFRGSLQLRDNESRQKNGQNDTRPCPRTFTQRLTTNMYPTLTDSTDYIFLVLLDDLAHLENRVMRKPGAKRGRGGGKNSVAYSIPGKRLI